MVTRLRAGQGRNHGSSPVACVVYCSGQGHHQASGRTELPIKPILKAPHAGVNWSGIDADQSLPSSAEAKNGWRSTSTLPLSTL